MDDTPPAGDNTPPDQPPTDGAAAQPDPLAPGTPTAATPPGTPPPEWGSQTPSKKKSGKGCLIALVVVLALIVGGGWFGWMFIRDKANEAGVSLGGGPAGLIPGLDDECVRFQASIMFTSMSGIMTMGTGELEGQLDEMYDLAPDAIRDDVRVFSDALSEAMSQGLVGATASPEEQAANEARVEEILESPEVQQATENIERWAEENCEVDAGTGLTP